MKSIIGFIFLFFLVNQGFSQFSLSEEHISVEKSATSSDGFSYKNLKIFPLVGGQKFRKANEHVGNYTNLEEALQNKKIEIVEMGNVSDSASLSQQRNSQSRELQRNNEEDVQQYNNRGRRGNSDQVNKLFARNLSKDTIFLMAGEVIKGGKQDRTLAQDMILPPSGELVELPVFCVEHHRWSYHRKRGNFDGYSKVASNSVRSRAVVSKNQGEVWQYVDSVTRKANSRSATGTYASIFSSDSLQKIIQEYTDYFEKALNNVENCIGFVAATGDTILGCDIFATTPLFRKQMKNLLNSYVTEAVLSGKKVSIRSEKITQYLEHFLGNQELQEKRVNEKGTQFKYKNKSLHLNTY